MLNKPLGQLKQVDLRDVWLSESGDFTPWLAKEENLKLLGDTIGIELELDSQEKEVGPFRADILCKDTMTDNWVLIENQLQRTDHTHLGQLLTYAAGLNAVTIVWISRQFTEEHRAALDWLNERTDETINLFGLEIELWQIGDSPVAPKFNIVSQPNDWARTVQKAASGSGELSPYRQLQLKFWTAFKQFMETNGSFIKCQKPFPQSWINYALGFSETHLTSTVTVWNSETGKKGPEIRAEIYLKGPKAKSEFAILEKQKEAIEADLGFKLGWLKLENSTSCRLYTRKSADFTDESQWPELFEWLRARLEKMHQVFVPLVKDLKQSSLE